MTLSAWIEQELRWDNSVRNARRDPFVEKLRSKLPRENR